MSDLAPKTESIMSSTSAGEGATATTKPEIPAVTWDDCVGLDGVKKELREIVFYHRDNPEVFKKFGMSPSGGILLYGPRACGKTLLAKAVANELAAKFMHVQASEVLTKQLDSDLDQGVESNVRAVFDKAREEAPCLLYISEVEHILSWSMGIAANDEAGQRAADRLGNQMMTELDGIRTKEDIVIIGATSRPDLLDSIFRRPGRLDQLIHVPCPDETSRISIIKQLLMESGVSMQPTEIEYIASRTTGNSRGQLKDIFLYAVKLAEAQQSKKREDPPEIQRVHIEEAIKTATPTSPESDIEHEKCELYAQQISDARGFHINFRFPSDGDASAAADVGNQYSDDDDDLYS